MRYIIIWPAQKNLPFPPRQGRDLDNMVIFWIKNIMLIPPSFLHFLSYVYLSVSNTYSVGIVCGPLFKGKHICLLTREDFWSFALGGFTKRLVFRKKPF